jgi:hypothetical protein
VVEYLNGINLIKVGKIVTFFEKNSVTYCILEMLNKKKKEYSGEEDIENLIERYFFIAEGSNKTLIVQLKNLLRKCVKIEIDDDTYLSYYVENKEHD